MNSSFPMSAIGCSAAEQADAVRPVAVLEAAEDLALGEQQIGTNWKTTAKMTSALRSWIHQSS